MNTHPNPDLEQKLNVLYNNTPAPDFVERLEKNLLAHAIASQGRTSTRKLYLPRRVFLPRLALAAACILLAAIVILLTPQGRAWAHSTLRFFTRTASLPPTPTAQPVVMVDATPGILSPAPTSPLDQYPAFYDDCGDLSDPRCTVDKIRGMVSFPVNTFASLPSGLKLIGVTGGPDKVTLVYRWDDLTGSIWLSQGIWSDNEALDWKIAISATVETVSIGNSTGEYVKGYWNNSAGSDILTWDPSREIQVLRWVEGDIFFDIKVFDFGSHKYQGLPLDQASVIKMAQSLTTESTTTSNIDPLHLKVPEAESLSGFDVVEPAQLPEGFSFSHAAYQAEKNNVCLYYLAPPRYDFVGLVIVQSTASLPQVRDLIDSSYAGMETSMVPTVISQTVVVGGAVGGQALYAGKIGYSTHSLCGGVQIIADEVLLWQASDGKYFVIFANSYSGFGGFLTKLEMRRLAESLNGVSTIPADTIDPERLHSVADAERMAGFHIKAPAKVPEWYVFDHASYLETGAIREVRLAYAEVNGGPGFTIDQRNGVTETLETIYHDAPDMYDEPFTVRGQPALYWQDCYNNGVWMRECGQPQELIWFEAGVEYNIWAGFSADTAKETLIAIAESLR